MDDGQVLTALAKNVKNLKTFNPKQDMEVTHWYLNKQDITKAIYHNGDRNIDEATTAMRLQSVIEGFHRRFISANPINIDVSTLKKEIDGMVLDLSDVVFGGNSKTEESNNELNATTEELTLSMSNIMETEEKNVDALKVFFREHLSGKYVNTVIGKVWFTKKETEHKFRGNVHKNDLTLKIIPHTIDILKNGNYLGRAELHKDRSDGIVGFHVFEKELNIDNLIIMTEIDVAESDPKQYTYNITHEKAIGWKKRKENATYSASYRQSTSINTIMPKDKGNVNMDSIGEVDDRWEAYDDPYSSIHIMSARDKNGKLLSPEEVMAIFNAKENDQKLTTTAQPLQKMTEEEAGRLVRSFKEIVDFASKNNREPQETKENIEERKLWSRLNGIRGDEDKKAILKQYDTLGLLEGTFKPQVQEETKEDRFYIQWGGPNSGWNNTRYIIRDRENKNNGSDEIAGFVRYGNDTPEIDPKYRDNEELMKFIESNFAKKDEDKQAQEADYTITLPSGAEKYINAIKGAFAQDSDLKGLKASFNVGGTVMDAIEKSQISIEGESSKIKTKMAQTIYFASIGYDKIEGKEGARMPSVELVRNAEYIKGKTGVDYEIRHHQTAIFETQKIEIDMNEAGKSNALFLPIGKFEGWSVKERWLASGMNRKRTIEYILKQLKDEAKGNTTEEPKTEDESELSKKLEAIKGFMGEAQYSILKSAINKPNNEFEDVINELYQTITTMPKTYEQDGKGNEAIAYLHYFKGGNDWWITEKDKEAKQLQAFGLASVNGYEPELGYISIEELKSINAELDFYWTPKTIGEIKGEEKEEDEYQEDEEADEELETVSEAEYFIDNYGKENEQPKVETKDEETATATPIDYSKYQGALSRILLATIDTLDDVETDLEIIENAYNANPDDEELKNIYQQVLDKLDEMAGI